MSKYIGLMIAADFASPRGRLFVLPIQYYVWYCMGEDGVCDYTSAGLRLCL